MSNIPKAIIPEVSLSVMEAIYQRRSVRNYLPGTLDQAVIHQLLAAAVQAPTAMHEEPWVFAIIEDRNRLDRLSESAKEQVRLEAQSLDADRARHLLELVNRPDFHVFYNAWTLLVIYSRPMGQFVVADCWLAAENLMLAACAQGLGTCVIGLAIGALNRPEWKAELDIPAEMTAIAPIIVGVPAGEVPLVPRKLPEIRSWK